MAVLETHKSSSLWENNDQELRKFRKQEGPKKVPHCRNNVVNGPNSKTQGKQAGMYITSKANGSHLWAFVLQINEMGDIFNNGSC